MRFDLSGDRLGLFRTTDFPGRVGDCFLVPFFFEVVDFRDQLHHGLGVFRFDFERIAELAEDVRPAGHQDDFRVRLRIVAVSGVGVALQYSVKSLYQVLHVLVPAVVPPFEHHRAAGRVNRPEVSLPAAGFSSVDVFDKGFVDLEVAGSFGFFVDQFVDRPHP